MSEEAGFGSVFAHGLVEIAREHRTLAGFVIMLVGFAASWVPLPEEPVTRANGNPRTGCCGWCCKDCHFVLAPSGARTWVSTEGLLFGGPLGILRAPLQRLRQGGSERASIREPLPGPPSAHPA